MGRESWLDQHHIVHVFKAAFQAANGDMFNGNPTTDVICLQDWGRATWVIACGTGAVGTAKIQVQSCSNATPSVATAIPFMYRAQLADDTWGAWTEAAVAADGFTTAAQADKAYEVTIRSADLLAGHAWARLITTEVADAAVHGSIFCILTEPRYPREIPQTVIA